MEPTERGPWGRSVSIRLSNDAGSEGASSLAAMMLTTSLLEWVAFAAAVGPTPPLQVPRYRILAELDPASHTVSCETVIEIPGGLDSPLVLDFSSAGVVHVDAIEVDGEWLEVQAGSSVFELPVSGEQGTAKVAAYYRAEFDAELRSVLGYDAFFSTDPGTHWYPDVRTPDGVSPRFRDFEVDLTHPRETTVLTSGQPVPSDHPEEGLSRERFVAEHVEGFALNVGEGFRRLELSEDELSVVALFPASLTETFERAAQRTREAASWYRDTYGFFPVPVVGIAPGHPTYSGGFPSSNLYYLHLGNTSDDFLRGITAHELGHYYWGKFALSDSERRLDWLMLGCGIWADQLYLAEVRGVPLDEQWRKSKWFRRYVEVLVLGHEQRLGLTSEEEAALDFDYNSKVRHAKGALGVYLQARRLGPQRFLELQRKLLREHRYRSLSTADFIAALEDSGAKGAGAFFAAWTRGDALLGFEAASIESRPVGEGFAHTVRVTRTGNVPYPVEVRLRDREGNEVDLVAGEATTEQLLHGRSSAALADVVLDPHGVLPLANSAHREVLAAFESARSKAENRR